MNKKQGACVRLDPEVYAALKALASVEHRSVEGQIRLLIHQHLQKVGLLATGRQYASVSSTDNEAATPIVQ